MGCKVVGCLNSQGFKFCGISSSDAPDFIDWVQFECLYPLLITVNHATVTIALVLLSEVRGHLCKCFVWGQTDTDRHPNVLLYLFMQILAPFLQVQMLHAIKVDEALVNGIAKICRNLFTDNAYYTTCQFSVQFIVGREHGNLLVRELLGQLEIWSSLNPHLLSFIRPRYYASVVIRQYYHRHTFQIRPKDTLT